MCEWALHEAGNWQLNSKVKVGAFTPSMRHFCYRLMPRASTQNRTLPPASQWLQRSRWPLAERSQLMGSVRHVFDWMFSMIWLCSFHKMTNQTCQQKIEKKNIKSCEINLDLGDNMRQHAHLHRCSICPNGLLQALQDAQSRSLLLIALNSYLCVRVSISTAFRLVRCIIFLMKVWQKRHHCTEHWEISKPYVEVLLKILRGSNLYWWSFSRFVGIFQDLGRQKRPKHAKTWLSS